MKNSRSLFIQVISILILSFSYIQTIYSQDFYEEIVLPDTLGIISMLPFSHDTIIIGITSNNPYAWGSAYRSFDGGNSWEFAGLQNSNVICLSRGNEDTLYAGTSWGIYSSGDYGDSWEQILYLNANVVEIVRLQSGQIFAGFAGGIMRSLDNGTTWDTSLALNQNSAINSILPISEYEIYAGGVSYTSSDAGVFKSTDLGQTWNYIGLVNHNIQTLGMNADHELFAGCYYTGLLKTSNNGLTWETVLPNHDVVCMIINVDGIYVGCDSQDFPNGGILYSSDNGESWEDRTYNITNKNLKQIVITPDQYLFSLSRYESTVLGPPFNRSADPVEIDESDSSKFQKVKIFPNPSTGNFTVNYTLDKKCLVTLSILSSSGQCLVEIQKGKLDKGKYHEMISGLQLPVGIYFIKLSMDKVITDAQKVIILK